MGLHKLLAKPLAASQVKALVEAERSRILAVCRPKAIFLFGSAACGEMTDGSDLDLLVVIEHARGVQAARDAYYLTTSAQSWPVDIVFVTAADFQRRSQVGGICMVCRQEGQLLFGDAT